MAPDKPDRSALNRRAETTHKPRPYDEPDEYDDYESDFADDYEEPGYDDAAADISRARTTETINRATSQARVAGDRPSARRAATVSARPAAPAAVKRADKKEPGMIDFKEEIKKYKPLLDVDDIEDSISFDEMTDVSDLMQQILKSVRS
jgi:hypothetical protein